MTEKKSLIIFISNIVAVALLAKILPVFIRTQEYKIERPLLVYLMLSLVAFLFLYNKKTKNSR